MGIFDFVKEAGDSLGNKVFDATHKEADLSGPVEIPQERLDELRKQHIEKACNELDLDIDSVQVSVSVDKATLQGSVPDQSTCEKVTLAAGNQQGIAQVDCQLSVENPEPEATFYTVQAGDTLGKIAQDFYGNAGKYPVIFEANQPMLKDPDRIYPGQQLRIPAE